MHQRARTTSAVAGAAIGSAAAVWAACWLGQDVAGLVREPADPAALLLAATELALLLTLARCTLAALLTLTAIATRARAGWSGRVAVRVSPRVVRPLVAALLTVGLAATAGPASAAPRSDPARSGTLPAAGWTTSPQSAQQQREPSLPAAGWVPEVPRTVASTPPVSLVAAAPRRPVEREVGIVVRRGDSLWAVVARSLGPQASDARVAAEWPRWWAANRSTIGDDPNLLLPGTRLRPPSGWAVAP